MTAVSSIIKRHGLNFVGNGIYKYRFIGRFTPLQAIYTAQMLLHFIDTEAKYILLEKLCLIDRYIYLTCNLCY